MNSLTSRSSTLILVVLLASLLYVGLLGWGSTGQVGQHLSGVSYELLARVVLLVTAGYLLRFLRWEYYLRELGYRVPVAANLRIYTASFLMAISPGKVGEAAKSYFLKEEYDVPATPTVAAYFCERFTDVLAMILLTSGGLLIYPRGGWVIGAIVVLQLGVLVALQFPGLVEEWFFGPLENVSFVSDWIGNGRRFYERSGELLSLGNLLVGTAFGVLSWGLEGLCLGLILWELGFTSLSMPLSVFVFCAAVLLGTAAMLPGGLGSSEALMIAMLIYFGAGRSVATSATVLVRFLTLWYGVALGLICWGLSWRQLRRKEHNTVQ